MAYTSYDQYKEELEGLGADPRSAATLATRYFHADKYAREREEMAARAVRRSRRGGGYKAAARVIKTGMAKITGGETPREREDRMVKDIAKLMQKEVVEPAREAIEAEKKILPQIQKIRERRDVVAQKEASLLRRTTGRRAMLVSPQGGRGFFGGYLKG